MKNNYIRILTAILIYIFVILVWVNYLLPLTSDIAHEIYYALNNKKIKVIWSLKDFFIQIIINWFLILVVLLFCFLILTPKKINREFIILIIIHFLLLIYLYLLY